MFYIVMIVLGGAFVVGSTTVASGVYAGIIIFLGMAIVYRSFPMPLRKTIVFFRVLVDFTVSGGVFAMVGGSTSTSLLAAVTCGILVTLGLHQQACILDEKSMLVQDVEALLKGATKL